MIPPEFGNLRSKSVEAKTYDVFNLFVFIGDKGMIFLAYRKIYAEWTPFFKN